MPPPTNDQDSKDVHVVTWPLFNSSKKSISFEEVQQAPGISNCPVAAVLSALAFTSDGQKTIKSMIIEKAEAVLTDVSGAAKALSNPPSDLMIRSNRYFKVKLGVGVIDISDILYTEDHDSGWSLLYIRDPGDHCIWAAIIEKALATHLKSYENFDAMNITTNDFWEKITGVKPRGIQIKADTPLETIVSAARASVNQPTIGASKPDGKYIKVVSEFHGFAIVGLQGSHIRLYDPAKAKIILISPADFRHDFMAILHK